MLEFTSADTRTDDRIRQLGRAYEAFVEAAPCQIMGEA
jgi:hypothetical protein